MKDWYRTFFDRLYYETYRPREHEERNLREARFIAKALGLPKGSLLLDIGCGYARHAVYLAKMGYRVVGIDLSNYLLERAKERIREFNVDVNVVRMDMRALGFIERFDGAYMFFTTFGYFAHQENLRVLKEIAHVLKRNGRLLIDIWNKYFMVHRFVVGGCEQYTWYESGGYTILEVIRFDIENEAVINERTFLRDGRIIEKRMFSVKTYSYAELKMMLEEAGMTLIKAYGDYEGRTFRLNSPRLIVVAEKL